MSSQRRHCHQLPPGPRSIQISHSTSRHRLSCTTRLPGLQNSRINRSPLTSPTSVVDLPLCAFDTIAGWRSRCMRGGKRMKRRHQGSDRGTGRAGDYVRTPKPRQISFARIHSGREFLQSVLSVRGVSKTYPGVMALRRRSFLWLRGKIRASAARTVQARAHLLRFSWASSSHSGSIAINGQVGFVREPQQAQAPGLGRVAQELSLAPHLSSSTISGSAAPKCLSCTGELAFDASATSAGDTRACRLGPRSPGQLALHRSACAARISPPPAAQNLKAGRGGFGRR